MAGPNIARLGTPDMKPVVIGGPSASGKTRGGAIEALFAIIRQVIILVGAKAQMNEVDKDMRAIRGKIAKDLAADQTRGVLVTLQFIVMGQNDAFRYVSYRYGRGVTPSEAVQDQVKRGNIRPGTRSNEAYRYKPLWYPPQKPTGRYRRPFPIAAQGCFLKGRAILQKVKWTTIQGFDDEFTWNDKLPKAGKTYRFDVLVPPSSVWAQHGNVVSAEKLPIVDRAVGSGGKRIKVVNLNTKMPGDVTAAMIFPADITTEVDFAKFPETEQSPIGALRGLVNFRHVRWVRPENIQLL